MHLCSMLLPKLPYHMHQSPCTMDLLLVNLIWCYLAIAGQKVDYSQVSYAIDPWVYEVQTLGAETYS